MDKTINSKERVQKFGEVFTPDWVVKQMCDSLQSEAGEDTFAPEKTFFDPCVGEGQFPLEILRRKFARCKKRRDYTTALESVYAMDIQADNVEITIANIIKLCEEFFRPTKAELDTIKDHVIQADSLKIMRMWTVMEGRSFTAVRQNWTTVSA